MTYESNQLAKYNSWLAHSGIDPSQYLIHYGIKGQKWGIRRWQNEDGSLTPAGKEHYGVGSGGNRKLTRLYGKEMKKMRRLADNTDIELQKNQAAKYDSRAKAAIKIAGAGAAVALGGHGAGEAIRAIYRGKSDADLNEEFYDKKWREPYQKIEKWAKEKDDMLEKLWNSGEKGREEYEKLLPSLKNEYDRKLQDLEDEYDALRDRVRNSNDPKAALADETIESKIARGVKYAGAAVAVGAGGAAAYNKARAVVAKNRTTEKGHAAAVAKAKAQYEKIEKTFSNTPYMSLFKQQIEAYKKEHPNSELTDKQIFKNIVA